MANARHLRSIGTTPAARWPADRAGMVALPPVAPKVGLTGRIRLSRDYYVRIDGNDYSVNPAAIGRFVDWIATPALIAVTCAEQIVATHERVWASGGHDHRSRAPGTARAMRAEFAATRDPARGSRPAPTPTGTSWPCARCPTTTRSTAWSSTPPPTRPAPTRPPPLKGSR